MYAHTNDISVLYIIILYYIDSIKPTIKDKTRQRNTEDKKRMKNTQDERKQIETKNAQKRG